MELRLVGWGKKLESSTVARIEKAELRFEQKKADMMLELKMCWQWAYH
jgi:hypothetical protein